MDEEITHHIMVDLETLGLAPDATILSIGAVVFTSEGIVDEFYKVITVTKDRSIDIDTVRWWLQQSPKAQSVFTDASTPLHIALADLYSWASKYEDILLWSNGNKDIVWLTDAYEQYSLTPFWQYWQERDFRTLKNTNPQVSITDEEVAHNALYDARWQARYMLKLSKNNYITL